MTVFLHGLDSGIKSYLPPESNTTLGTLVEKGDKCNNWDKETILSPHRHDGKDYSYWLWPEIILINRHFGQSCDRAKLTVYVKTNRN